MSPKVLFVAGFALAAVLLPFMGLSTSHLNLAILMLMAAQLGVAWNIIGGYAGQVSLGMRRSSASAPTRRPLLLLQFGVNPWLGMLAGGVTAALASLAFGWSCFRPQGPLLRDGDDRGRRAGADRLHRMGSTPAVRSG
jgi:branched-chain amino acid transport system permease protein